MSTMSEGLPPQKPRHPRRQFTDEFRAGAVHLVIDEHRSIPQVARELDLTESALRLWVDRARADRVKGWPGVLTTAEVQVYRSKFASAEAGCECLAALVN